MKNSKEFILRCKASGLFLSDAVPHFDVIAVTTTPKRALVLTDGEAAEKARKMLHALYPSFDWRAVERDQYTEVSGEKVFLRAA